ncbi:MAG: DUF4199 domain-containing protein [Spirosomataceae bacterium]
MEQQPTTTARTALKWGVITGIASIVFSTIIFVTGQFMNQALTSLGLIILIVTMVLAMKEYRTFNGGFMTYGQGLGIGALMAGISGFIGATFNYIYNEFIDTTIRQQILDKTREKFEEQGMDDAQIDAAIEMTAKFSSPGITFAIGIVFSIIFGFVIALVISAIMKKDKPFELE